MCLAVPGRLVRWIERDPLLAVAEIDFGGITKPCHMACVLDAVEGDYVLIHAGIALTIVDERSAQESLKLLAIGETRSNQSPDSR